VKAAVLRGVRDIRFEEVAEPELEEPTDAIVSVRYAAVCGSDLHPYRGRFGGAEPGRRPGHEFVGEVTSVGDEVDLEPGALVLAPFAFSCGACEHCERREVTSCVRGGTFGSPRVPGSQADAVRVPFAASTLWEIPPALATEDALPATLLLGDVMGTGEHAVRMARIEPGETVVVVGDGAVGLCATIAARLRDPSQLVVVGHHTDRLELARGLGASEVIDGRDVHLADEVYEAIGGLADVVLETVGGDGGVLDLALALVRDHGRIGSVGVFGADASIPVAELFERNVRVAAGVAPTGAYFEELAPLLADGAIDPRPVLSHSLPLADVAEAYRMMDERDAVKVLLRA
jgi:alcohol dehydrogenase